MVAVGDHVTVRGGAAGEALPRGEHAVVQRSTVGVRGALGQGRGGPGGEAHGAYGGHGRAPTGQHEPGLDLRGRLGERRRGRSGPGGGGDPLGPVAVRAQAADVDRGGAAGGDVADHRAVHPVGARGEHLRRQREQAGGHALPALGEATLVQRGHERAGLVEPGRPVGHLHAARLPGAEVDVPGGDGGRCSGGGGGRCDRRGCECGRDREQCRAAQPHPHAVVLPV